MDKIPGGNADLEGVSGQGSVDPAQAAIAKWKKEMRARAVDYFDGLKTKGVAPVRYHSLKGRTFIDVTIEGRRFKGQVRKGPFIVSEKGEGDCLLTCAGISYGTDYLQMNGRSRWAIAKYRTHHRILLDGLSPDGIRALACEFGLVMHGDGAADALSESECFVQSRACTGLYNWTRSYPSLAMRLLRDFPDFTRGLDANSRPPRKSRYRNIHEFEYFMGS